MSGGIDGTNGVGVTVSNDRIPAIPGSENRGCAALLTPIFNALGINARIKAGIEVKSRTIIFQESDGENEAPGLGRPKITRITLEARGGSRIVTSDGVTTIEVTGRRGPEIEI